AVRLRPLLHFAQQRALVLEAGQQELTDANRRAFDRGAADQECLRPGAAEQTGCLEIVEHQTAVRCGLALRSAKREGWPGLRHQLQGILTLADRRHDLAERRSA